MCAQFTFLSGGGFERHSRPPFSMPSYRRRPDAGGIGGLRREPPWRKKRFDIMRQSAGCQKIACCSPWLYAFHTEPSCHDLHELKGNALAVGAVVPFCRCVFQYRGTPFPRCRGPPDQSEFLAIQTDRR